MRVIAYKLGASSFRDGPQGPGPEPITTGAVMDSGLAATRRPGMTRYMIRISKMLHWFPAAAALIRELANLEEL